MLTRPIIRGVPLKGDTPLLINQGFINPGCIKTNGQTRPRLLAKQRGHTLPGEKAQAYVLAKQTRCLSVTSNVSSCLPFVRLTSSFARSFMCSFACLFVCLFDCLIGRSVV